MGRRRTRYCSFCEKSEHEVFKLISQVPAYICDECVDLCAEILAAERAKKRSLTTAEQQFETLQQMLA